MSEYFDASGLYDYPNPGGDTRQVTMDPGWRDGLVLGIINCVRIDHGIQPAVCEDGSQVTEENMPETGCGTCYACWLENHDLEAFTSCLIHGAQPRTPGIEECVLCKLVPEQRAARERYVEAEETLAERTDQEFENYARAVEGAAERPEGPNELQPPVAGAVPARPPQRPQRPAEPDPVPRRPPPPTRQAAPGPAPPPRREAGGGDVHQGARGGDRPPDERPRSLLFDAYGRAVE